MTKLLTVVILAQNSCGHVHSLVSSLCTNAGDSADLVDIVVFDNASTDDTAASLQSLLTNGLSFKYVHRSVSIGLNDNVTAALAVVNTRYCWLLGDNSFPFSGALPSILEALARVQPDLLYLQSAPNALDSRVPKAQPTFLFKPVNDVEFAARANRGLPLMSSLVFDLSHYKRIAPNGPSAEFQDTQLAQLHWVLLLLKHGKTFLTSAGAVIKTTNDDSSDYLLSQVFAVNLPRLVDAILGSSSFVGRVIKKGNAWSNLPRLIYTLRLARRENLKFELLPAEFLSELRGTSVTALLYRTILMAPPAVAKAAQVLLRVVGNASTHCLRVRGALHCGWLGLGRVIDALRRRARVAADWTRGAVWGASTGSAERHPVYVGPNGQFLGLRGVRLHGKLTMGRRCRIELYDRYAGKRFTPVLWIGANVSMENDCHIGVVDRVELHDGVMLASRVYISDHAHGSTDPSILDTQPVSRPLHSKGPVIIERNAWIGEGVAILPGVRIGEAAIVGANAVVTRDVPPRTVVGGAPARIIRAAAGASSAPERA